MSVRTRYAILAAVVVVVVSGLIAGVTVARSNSQITPDHADGGDGYCADMPDSVGLYTGNPVTQMGVRVGAVTAISSAGGHVRVAFSLDPGRSYPADVRAVTRSKSLLADRSLELVGNYQSGPTLQPGQCVSVQKSFTPKSISEITGSAADFLGAFTQNGNKNLQQALDGLDKALQGTGPDAARMFEHAAAAAQTPDQFVADVGASIANMAPLTDSALRQWDQILSIIRQMPEIVTEGTRLFGDVAKFDRGVGWTVATIYDIQRNYGDILWPIMNGPVRDIIALAAARAPDLQKLYATVPSVAVALDKQVRAGGLSVPYTPPTVTIGAAQCRALRVTCSGGQGNTTTVNPFTLLLQGAQTR